jgi:hypothetical protein
MYLPLELVQAIVNYLQTKPYNEVAPFLAEIHKIDMEDKNKSLKDSKE